MNFFYILFLSLFTSFLIQNANINSAHSFSFVSATSDLNDGMMTEQSVETEEHLTKNEIESTIENWPNGTVNGGIGDEKKEDKKKESEQLEEEKDVLAFEKMQVTKDDNLHVNTNEPSFIEDETSEILNEEINSSQELEQLEQFEENIEKLAEKKFIKNTEGLHKPIQVLPLKKNNDNENTQTNSISDEKRKTIGDDIPTSKDSVPRILKKPEYIKYLFNTLYEIFLIIKLGAKYRYEHFLIPLKNIIISNFLNQIDYIFLIVLSFHKTGSEKYKEAYGFILILLFLFVGKLLLQKMFFKQKKIDNEALKNKQSENVYIENLLKRILFNLEKNKNMEHYETTLNEILENTENIIVNINLINKENKNIYTDIISNINNIGLYTYISTQALKNINSKSDHILNELISNRLILHDENDSKNLSDLNELNDLKKNYLNDYDELPDIGETNVNNITHLKQNLLNSYYDNEINNVKNPMMHGYEEGDMYSQYKGNIRNEFNMNEKKMVEFPKKKMAVNEYMNENTSKAHFGNVDMFTNRNNTINNMNNANINTTITTTTPLNDNVVMKNKHAFPVKSNLEDISNSNQNVLPMKNLNVELSSKGNALEEMSNTSPLNTIPNYYNENSNFSKRTSNIGNTNSTAVLNTVYQRGSKGLGIMNVNPFMEKGEKRKSHSGSTANINSLNVNNYSEDRVFEEPELNAGGKKDYVKSYNNATNNEYVLKKNRGSFFYDEVVERDKEQDIVKSGVSPPPLPPLINSNMNCTNNLSNMNDINKFTGNNVTGCIASGTIDINSMERDKGIDQVLEKVMDKDVGQNQTMAQPIRRMYSNVEKESEEKIKSYSQSNVSNLVVEEVFENRNDAELKMDPTIVNNYLNKAEEVIPDEMLMANSPIKPGVSYFDSMKSQNKSKDPRNNTSSSQQLLEGNFNRTQKYVTQRRERQKIIATKSPFS